MSKYFSIVAVLVPLISCCTSADDTTTSSIESLNKKHVNKEKNKTNNIKLKQNKLNELQEFLTKLKNSKSKIDHEKIEVLICNVGTASNTLKKIINNKYSESKLQTILDSLNEKLKTIEQLYRELFNLPNNTDSNNLCVNNNTVSGVKPMTSLNWNKDTRNNSNVITNPLDVSHNDETEPNIKESQFIVVDLSKPLTPTQVEEYYSSYNINNNIPEQGTIPIGKSYEENSIDGKKLHEEKQR